MTSERYHFLVRRLHWITVGLFVWQWLSRTIAKQLPDGSELAFHLVGLHTVGGFIILMLALTRIVVRIGRRSPGWPNSMGRFQRIAAMLVHGGLYAIMIALPVTGLAATRAPAFAMMHTALGWIALCMIAIHAGAALWHRFVSKDAVFTRIQW